MNVYHLSSAPMSEHQWLSWKQHQTSIQVWVLAGSQMFSLFNIQLIINVLNQNQMSRCGCTCSKLQQTRDHEWCLHSTGKAEFTNRSLLINHCLTNWPHRMQLAVHCHGSHVFMPLVGVVNWLYSICMQLANVFPWKKPVVPRSQGVPTFSFW